MISTGVLMSFLKKCKFNMPNRQYLSRKNNLRNHQKTEKWLKKHMLSIKLLFSMKLKYLCKSWIIQLHAQKPFELNSKWYYHVRPWILRENEKHKRIPTLTKDFQKNWRTLRILGQLWGDCVFHYSLGPFLSHVL